MNRGIRERIGLFPYIVRAHARCRLPVSRASLKDAFVAGENDFGYNDNMVAVFPSG